MNSSTIREATLAAYDVIVDRYGADRIIIGGTSAGGGLAVSTMLQLHRSGKPLPRAAVLFSPWLDMTVSHAEIQSYEATDMLLPPDVLRRDGALYAGPIHPADPLLSPRFAGAHELAALPPTVITVGEREILRPEAEEFAANMVGSGATASLHVERFGQHAAVIVGTPEGSEVFDQAVASVRSIVAPVGRAG